MKIPNARCGASPVNKFAAPTATATTPPTSPKFSSFANSVRKHRTKRKLYSAKAASNIYAQSAARESIIKEKEPNIFCTILPTKP